MARGPKKQKGGDLGDSNGKPKKAGFSKRAVSIPAEDVDLDSDEDAFAQHKDVVGLNVSDDEGAVDDGEEEQGILVCVCVCICAYVCSGKVLPCSRTATIVACMLLSRRS